MVARRETCLCGLHTGTKIVGWFTVITNILAIIFSIGLIIAAFVIDWKKVFKENPEKEETTVHIVAVISGSVSILFGLFGVFVGATLLYALKNKRPGLYWVFIIVTFVSIIFSLINTLPLPIFSIACFFAAGHKEIGSMAIVSGIGSLVTFLICGLFLIAQAYFGIFVVNQSRQLLRDEFYRTANNVVHVTPMAPQYQQSPYQGSSSPSEYQKQQF